MKKAWKFHKNIWCYFSRFKTRQKDEGPLSRLRRSDSIQKLDNQIADILRGKLQTDQRIKNIQEDLLAKAFNVDWSIVETPLIPYNDFINPQINKKLEIDKDYVNYKLNFEDGQKNFTMISFPFILGEDLKKFFCKS